MNRNEVFSLKITFSARTALFCCFLFYKHHITVGLETLPHWTVSILPLTFSLFVVVHIVQKPKFLCEIMLEDEDCAQSLIAPPSLISAMGTISGTVSSHSCWNKTVTTRTVSTAAFRAPGVNRRGSHHPLLFKHPQQPIRADPAQPMAAELCSDTLCYMPSLCLQLMLSSQRMLPAQH